MAYPTISTLPTAPRRGDPSELFVSRANAWIAALEGWTGETNAAGTYIEGKAAEALLTRNQTQTIYDNTVGVYNNTVIIRDETSVIRDEVLDIEAGITSALNFKGRWVDLTGTLNIPSNVFHAGAYWTLLTNLADVTLSEPALENTDWALAGGGGGVGGGLVTEYTIETNITAEVGTVYVMNAVTKTITLPTGIESGSRIGLLNVQGSTDVLLSGTDTFISDSSTGKMLVKGESWTLVYIAEINKWVLE